MKNFLIRLFCVLQLSLFNCHTINAQTDSTNSVTVDTTGVNLPPGVSNPEDDEFNLFLLSWGIAFVCAVIIASLIGAMAAMVILIFIFLLISAGIISASFLVGFYKRSVTAGFRTFIVILSVITGIFLGAGGLWFCTKFFDLNLSASNALWIGAAGGCIGGILMGLIIFKALQLILTYFKNKLKLPV